MVTKSDMCPFKKKNICSPGGGFTYLQCSSCLQGLESRFLTIEPKERKTDDVDDDVDVEENKMSDINDEEDSKDPDLVGEEVCCIPS